MIVVAAGRSTVNQSGYWKLPSQLPLSTLGGQAQRFASTVTDLELFSEAPTVMVETVQSGGEGGGEGGGGDEGGGESGGGTAGSVV